MTTRPTLTPTGIRSDQDRPWVSVHLGYGYVDLDSHGLPRPLSSLEARHLARRLELAADALDAQVEGAPRRVEREAA